MYYPDVPALEPDELNLLCNEYLEHNATLDPHLADQMGRQHERVQRHWL